MFALQHLAGLEVVLADDSGVVQLFLLHLLPTHIHDVIQFLELDYGDVEQLNVGDDLEHAVQDAADDKEGQESCPHDHQDQDYAL